MVLTSRRTRRYATLGDGMKQLSGHDASFIYLETPKAHMAGATLLIYDQSTAPGGAVTYKGILEDLEQRLHLAATFRQKLVRVPMDLDHPYWVEAGDFDLEYHVRHIGLPKPDRKSTRLNSSHA